MHDVALAAYLPADRHLALTSGTELPTRTTGAALFADIVGFTALSGRLTAAHGARHGVDLLSQVLEAVYEAVVATIHDHAGSVIGFSGDAVTCWFDDHPIGLDGVPCGARRAVTCGLRLHDAIDGLATVELPDGPAAPVAIKVAIATGPATRHVVGDPASRLVEVLGGATVTRVGELERQAFLGQVVVDRETVDAVAGVEILPTAGLAPSTAVLGSAPAVAPTPWPAACEPLADEVAIHWVDHRLRGRHEVGRTELRPVVALFLRFTCTRFDLDPAGAGSQLDAFVRWVQASVAPADGHLLQVTVGDKSSYLYVSFGAPHAHEDLAARALLSALALRALPPELADLGPVQIGVAQGVCRVGAYGSRACTTYGALGDGTNLAARLMVAAGPGKVVVADDVARSAGPAFRTAPSAPLTAKGFADPVEVVELEGRLGYIAPRPAHRRRLAGRDVELAWLVERLERVAGGTGSSTSVRGEAGIGKSHLLAEAKRLLLASADITWVDCEAEERVDTALAPFLALLRDLTFQELADTDEARSALFDATIDSLVDEIGASPDERVRDLATALDGDRSYLAALIGLPVPGSPYEAHDRASRFERCLLACERLVRAHCARRPVVLHVADGHWLDGESRRLLERLDRVAGEAALAVVVDERPGDRDPQGEVLVLGPLDDDGLPQLVAMLVGGVPDPGLVASVAERAQGNPFFAEQLVLGLLEAERVRADATGRWTLDHDAASELPVSLSAVLVARLDRLPDEVSDLVQRGAVLGVEVELDVLRALAAPGEDVDGALAAAVDAGVWVLDVERPGRIEFHHALLRDAAYEMQPEARVRELHGRAAAAIAALDPGPARAADLARHHERAGDHAAALRELEVAALRAEQLPALREAKAHLLRAVGLAPSAGADPATGAAVLQRLAEVELALGEYDAAVAHFAQALGRADGARDRTELLRLTGEAHERLGRHAEAEAAYEAAIEALQDDPDGGLAGRLYAGLAMVNYDRGDLQAATDLAELALVFASSDDDPAHTARAHHNLCVIGLQRGDLGAAKHHGELSLRSAEDVGLPGGVATAHNDLGLLALATGDPDAAIEGFERAVELFEAAGNEPALARALGNLADGLQAAGRQEASFACLERAVAILADIGMGSDDVFQDMWRSGTW